MLERRRIREQVVTLLGAASGLAGVGIYDSLVTSLEPEETPAVCVYTPAESWESNGSNNGMPFFKVSTTLSVEAYVSASDEWASKLDDLIERAEAALFTNPDFVSGFNRIASASMSVSIVEGGEKPVAVAKHQYTLEYGWVFDPVVEDELTTVDIKIDAIDPAADPNTGNAGYAGGYPGPDGRIEGHTSVTFEQDDTP